MGAHFRTSLTIIMIFEISDTERKREHELRKYFTEFWTKPGASYDAFIAATPMAEGVTFEENELGWWARPANHDSKRALLYVHGGGYLQGSAKAYRGLASQLVRRTGIAALIIDYPLASFAKAPDAALAAWEWLVARGFEHIAFVGDSAGGGLALSTMATIRQRKPTPVAGVMFSPWVDLTLSGASMTDEKIIDPLLSAEFLTSAASTYLAGASPRDPRASPLFAELSGLPPLLIQVASDERLLDDSRRFVERAREAGVTANLELWNGMHHVFQLDLAHIESAGKALDNAASFLRGAFEKT